MILSCPAVSLTLNIRDSVALPVAAIVTPPPPTSTLFPYTTLFRSMTSSYHTATATGADITHTLASTLGQANRSEEHTSELQSLRHLVCRLLLEKKKQTRETLITA